MKQRRGGPLRNASGGGGMTTTTNGHRAAEDSSNVLQRLLQPTISAQRQHRLLNRLDTDESFASKDTVDDEDEHNDFVNYALLIVLYTLQGIPMGLSASMPFLIQQKMKTITLAAGTAGRAAAAASTSTAVAANAARLSFRANAVFALCSWPFSFKLLWAPVVDALFVRKFGRRKSWLVPVQTAAGLLMVFGSDFVERQLAPVDSIMNIKGVTAFFFALYFLMATQDIAVDGWALTMLSKKNRGRGPVCNSIGQNLGYFLSFVGFLALNDAESSDMLRRLYAMFFRRHYKINTGTGLVTLGAFLRFMGYFMLITTILVALFKHEREEPVAMSASQQAGDLYGGGGPEARLPSDTRRRKKKKRDDDAELDASEIGLKETYHRLWAVCQLKAVRWLFVVLFTYRLPTALSDNVKFLKAVEYGLSKSTTAMLSPTVILPLGILVPLVATRIWHDQPLDQFLTAYKLRVTAVPVLDICMLLVLKNDVSHTSLLFWTVVVASTALQSIVSSLQFNAQMTFFASRVDPAIGGSYMTLLNTAANLGGTWPASFIMWLTGAFTTDPVCHVVRRKQEVCTEGRDPFFVLSALLSVAGCLWILFLGGRVRQLAALPDDVWRTHLLDGTTTSPDAELAGWNSVSINNSTTTTNKDDNKGE